MSIQNIGEFVKLQRWPLWLLNLLFFAPLIFLAAIVPFAFAWDIYTSVKTAFQEKGAVEGFLQLVFFLVISAIFLGAFFAGGYIGILLGDFVTALLFWPLSVLYSIALPFLLARATESTAIWTALIGSAVSGLFVAGLYVSGTEFLRDIRSTQNVQKKIRLEEQELRETQSRHEAIRSELGELANWPENQGLLDYAASLDLSNLPHRSRELEQIGKPGMALIRAMHQGLERKRTAQGIEGERKTCSLITEQIETNPGMTVINTIVPPSYSNMDIDHVLIYGNAVIFIDSKNYKPGEYLWAGDSIENYANNGVNGGIKNILDIAVADVRERLDGSVSTYQCILIHNSNPQLGEVQIASHNREPGKPALLTANDFPAWLDQIARIQFPKGSGPLDGIPAKRHNDLVQEIGAMQPQHAR